MRHDPQWDDPNFEMDQGECQECRGRGCDQQEPISLEEHVARAIANARYKDGVPRDDEGHFKSQQFQFRDQARAAIAAVREREGDPAEAMRAKCEAIVRGYSRHLCGVDFVRGAVEDLINEAADDIAALKDNGEG